MTTVRIALHKSLIKLLTHNGLLNGQVWNYVLRPVSEIGRDKKTTQNIIPLCFSMVQLHFGEIKADHFTLHEFTMK